MKAQYTARHHETLHEFCTRCALVALSSEHNFVVTFNNVSILVEPKDVPQTIASRYWDASTQIIKDRRANICVVLHKQYTPSYGATRALCRLTMSNGKFITAVGTYADVLNKFDEGAELEVSGWSRGN